MKSRGELILGLHDEAMEYADHAYFARKDGDLEGFLRYSRLAYEKEEQAALSIESVESEPTRSVLHRSAATLAYDCGEYRNAENLIFRALVGNPPEEIADELRELYDKVKFARNLQLKDIYLGEEELQMALQGDAIGPGIAPRKLIFSRITDIEKLLQRTVALKNGQAYSERIPSAVRDNYQLFLSGLSANSFNVSLRVGLAYQPLLTGLGKFNDVFDVLMENVSLINQGDYDLLQANLREPAYYRNFIGLVKRIAPDGSAVSSVGLRARVGNQLRQVSFERNRHELLDIPVPVAKESGNNIELKDETQTVTGILKYADALESNQVRLQDEQENRWKITVPSGLMREVVKPHFEERVRVLGRPIKRKRNHLYLDHIESAGSVSSAVIWLYRSQRRSLMWRANHSIRTRLLPLLTRRRIGIEIGIHRRPNRVAIGRYCRVPPWTQGDDSPAGQADVDPATRVHRDRQRLLRIDPEARFADENISLPIQSLAAIGLVGLPQRIVAIGEQDGRPKRLILVVKADHDDLVADEIDLPRLATEHDDQRVFCAGQRLMREGGEADRRGAAAEKHHRRYALRAIHIGGCQIALSRAKAIRVAIPPARLNPIQFVDRALARLIGRAVEGPKTLAIKSQIGGPPKSAGDDLTVAPIQLHAEDRAAVALLIFTVAAGRADRDIESSVFADGEPAGPESRPARQVVDDGFQRAILRNPIEIRAARSVEIALVKSETVGQGQPFGECFHGVGQRVAVAVPYRYDRAAQWPRGVERAIGRDFHGGESKRLNPAVMHDAFDAPARHVRIELAADGCRPVAAWRQFRRLRPPEQARPKQRA